MKVLLVEPKYKNKYPPMGLMKISTYHKNKGDTVRFVKGYDPNVETEEWDRIYITTLFTFHFDITAKTIKHYIKRYDKDRIFVGGIMSSLMTEDLIEATGIDSSHILKGLFTDTSVVGDDNDVNVDVLPLDYDILEDIDYKYPVGHDYLAYTTRGCPNRCSFCAVPKLEPEFKVTNNILKQKEIIDTKYGVKTDLRLMDNNVLNASMDQLKKIVDDLCAAGFEKGKQTLMPSEFDMTMTRYRNGDRAIFLDNRIKAFLYSNLDLIEQRAEDQNLSEQKRASAKEKRTHLVSLIEAMEQSTDVADYMLVHEEEFREVLRGYIRTRKIQRYVDFNQGIDSRKINDENMELLGRLAIKPLRIAFDHVELKDVYCNAVKTAHKHGIRNFSNYILFNYKDKPEDLYERLKINIQLNEELKINVFSFPMKYAPVDRKDRKYIGEHWNKHALQNIGAILNVTKGVVGVGSSFFYKAFGHNLDEYRELLDMPRDMVVYRFKCERLGITDKWRNLYQKLTSEQKDQLVEIISRSRNVNQVWPQEFKSMQQYYINSYR